MRDLVMVLINDSLDGIKQVSIFIHKETAKNRQSTSGTA